MRQHPIPQNILDVEFKLFTKFTVKEFAYIATGIIIGALFIFLWTEDRMPGILAFPSFALFAGIGLILGLVPIQDQPADRILSNYVKAINRPTLRVWQGEEMKLRMKERKDAAKEAVVQVQKPSSQQMNLADAEETEQLEKIDKMMEETGLATTQQTAPVQQKPAETNTTLTRDSLGQYIVPNANVQLTGTINVVLVNKENQPISNATVVVKDNFGKTRLAVKSGQRGEVLTTKKLENGEYKIEIMHDQYTFNNIKFVVEQAIYPLIKITSL